MVVVLILTQLQVVDCDPNLWKFVYRPERLQVIANCIVVEGVIRSIHAEKDGDLHIQLRFMGTGEITHKLINSVNIARQAACLVVEPVCQEAVTQPDAHGICDGYAGPHYKLRVGMRVRIRGSHVLDRRHGWLEVHPAEIEILHQRRK